MNYEEAKRHAEINIILQSNPNIDEPTRQALIYEQARLEALTIAKHQESLQTEESHVTRKNEHGMTDLTPYNAFTGKMVYK